MSNKSKLKVLVKRPWLLPDNFLIYSLRKLSQRLPNNKNFGLLQAILYSWRIDVWRRYSSVARQVQELTERPTSILDVGAAGGTIKEFLPPDRYRLCTLDIELEALEGISDARLDVVAGSGCCLPFKDDSFDVVLSVDSLEHVPEPSRADYCCELKRVARRCVILCCPVDDHEGKFHGTVYDRRFSQRYRRLFKEDEKNVKQHLAFGLPKTETLIQLFPGATISGKQNCEIWLKYLIWESIPYLRLFAGLFYKMFLLKKDDLPPYHACLLFWRKS